MRYAFLLPFSLFGPLLIALLVGCGAKNGEPAEQPAFQWTEENAAPYANAIFSSWNGADEVCFSLTDKGIGLFLVHFSVTDVEEEYRGKWWLLASYDFVLLDNSSFVLKKQDVTGDFVSTPKTDGLICKKR